MLVEFDVAAPDPAGMVASLSSLGYSLPAAIADVIDNSISADAQNIDVDFTWAGRDSWVSVVDDGTGMTEKNLIIAMTVAARGPGTPRTSTDLGRFGVGLKSASFSQARQLTVATATDGTWHIRTWDLDVVEEFGEWRLLRGAGPETTALVKTLIADRTHGTVVLWRQLTGYRSDEVAEDDEKTQQQFYAEAERTGTHLGMVFARFLTGTSRRQLRLSNSPVKPWDPFLASHPSVQRLPAEDLPLADGSVRVEPYVLPNAQRLSVSAYEAAAGPQGWLGQQGFYVYRRDRLILAGDWLGIRGLRREEKFSLARIAVDIPAESDADWAVDVRKASVVPPVALRGHLRRIAMHARGQAADALRHRGRIAARRYGDPLRYVWTVRRDDGRISCRINRSHPLVQEALKGGQGDGARLRALLRLLEETVPVTALRVLHETDSLDDPEPFGGPGPSDEQTLEVAQQVFEVMLGQGRTAEEARAQLRLMPPFDQKQGFWNE
ncbi:ATP-binding protein [Streptomyces sp. NPDC001815]|uniref:ATP-binding protein n=1 Tax=Streptomyces sp. NPDC001815 TaxID=3154526 RepID=UPI0033212727